MIHLNYLYLFLLNWQANKVEGFLYQLLEISKNNDVDSHSRQLAAITFKDFVIRRWEAKEEFPSVTENEKNRIKEIIVTCFVDSPRTVRYYYI